MLRAKWGCVPTEAARSVAEGDQTQPARWTIEYAPTLPKKLLEEKVSFSGIRTHRPRVRVPSHARKHSHKDGKFKNTVLTNTVPVVVNGNGKTKKCYRACAVFYSKTGEIDGWETIRTVREGNQRALEMSVKRYKQRHKHLKDPINVIYEVQGRDSQWHLCPELVSALV